MAVLPKGAKPKTFWHSDSAARAVTEGRQGPGIPLATMSTTPGYFEWKQKENTT